MSRRTRTPAIEAEAEDLPPWSLAQLASWGADPGPGWRGAIDRSWIAAERTASSPWQSWIPIFREADGEQLRAVAWAALSALNGRDATTRAQKAAILDQLEAIALYIHTPLEACQCHTLARADTAFLARFIDRTLATLAWAEAGREGQRPDLRQAGELATALDKAALASATAGRSAFNGGDSSGAPQGAGPELGPVTPCRPGTAAPP
jgi:hypothetical protein